MHYLTRTPENYSNKPPNAGVEISFNGDARASPPPLMGETRIVEEEGGNLVIATVEKFYKEEKLGLNLMVESNNAILTVSNIAPTSPFQSSGLKTGMQIISINGVSLAENAEGESLMARAASLLKDSIGEIQVVATTISAQTVNNNPAPANTNKQSDHVVAKVYKQRQDEKLGVQFQREEPGGIFYISNVSSSSPFIDTDLQTGMKIKTINDVPMTGQPISFAIMLMKESVGELVIVAETINRGCNQKSTPNQEREPPNLADSCRINAPSAPYVSAPRQEDTSPVIVPTSIRKVTTPSEPNPMPTAAQLAPDTHGTNDDIASSPVVATKDIVPAAPPLPVQQPQPTTTTCYVTQEIVDGHIIVKKRTVFPNGREEIEKRIVGKQEADPPLEQPAPKANQRLEANPTTQVKHPETPTMTTPYQTTTLPPAESARLDPPVKHVDATHPVAASTTPTSETAKYLVVPLQSQWSELGSTTAHGKPAYIKMERAVEAGAPLIEEMDSQFMVAIAKQPTVSKDDIKEYIFAFSSEEVEIEGCTFPAGCGWYHITTKHAWVTLSARSLNKWNKYLQTEIAQTACLRVCSLVFLPGVFIMIPIIILHSRKTSKMRRFFKLAQRRKETMDGPSGETEHKHFDRYSKFYTHQGAWRVPTKTIEKFRRN